MLDPPFNRSFRALGDMESISTSLSKIFLCSARATSKDSIAPFTFRKIVFFPRPQTIPPYLFYDQHQSAGSNLAVALPLHRVASCIGLMDRYSSVGLTVPASGLAFA